MSDDGTVLTTVKNTDGVHDVTVNRGSQVVHVHVRHMNEESVVRRVNDIVGVNGTKRDVQQFTSASTTYTDIDCVVEYPQDAFVHQSSNQTSVFDEPESITVTPVTDSDTASNGDLTRDIVHRIFDDNDSRPVTVFTPNAAQCSVTATSMRRVDLPRRARNNTALQTLSRQASPTSEHATTPSDLQTLRCIVIENALIDNVSWSISNVIAVKTTYETDESVFAATPVINYDVNRITPRTVCDAYLCELPINQ